MLELRSGEHALLRYAHSGLHVLETGTVEAGHIGLSVTADNLPFCSDHELALMRHLVYDAAFIKDIGRERNGLLYCTSSLGRLTNPVRAAVPDLSFAAPESKPPVEIEASREPLLEPGPAGIVFSAKGVSGEVNPALLAQLDDPPMQFTGLLYDRQRKTVLPAAGHPDTLLAEEVLAQNVVQRGGTVYQPLCSDQYPVCVIAQEPIGAATGYRKGFVVACAAGGALLGMFLSSTLILSLRRQWSFEQKLRRAIRARKLFCVYQPIVAFDTNTVVGAEALARWTNEAGEPISPEMFIPVAEAKGFVGDVTRLLLEQVVGDLKRFLGRPGFRVSMNIASQDLADPAFFTHLARLMKESQIDPASLAFELTERSRTDEDFAKRGIAKLRAAGHAVYIDDFGTGYSSLGYLHDLSVDAVKVDRVFTQTIGTDSMIGVVLPQILFMASRLGLTVVVEGVETEIQADYFRQQASGILGQGYLLGKPAPAAVFKELFEMRTGENSRQNSFVNSMYR
ncbi:MAG TPA: EAL domain-containing protein [Terracidiphilus sp.]|jgi:sensor c-di-GMP phosphodiesterase-like protein